MRSHVEQHLAAAPADFTPDRSDAPDAATAKRGGAKVKGKGKVKVAAAAPPEAAGVANEVEPDAEGLVHETVVKDTSETDPPAESRTTRQGTTSYNLS